jgi:hypothetical protein
MNRLVRNVLLLLLLAVPCLALLPRLNSPTPLSESGLDQLLASRYTAATNRLGTPLIRPLEAARLVSYGDGALPDLRHGILYTGLASVSMKVLKETKGGQGQRATTLLGIVLLLSGGLTTLWLSSRCFPRRNARWAALFFVWSGGAILATITPGPGLLLAILGALLCAALLPLDVSASDKRASVGLALAAGALWGLLFLTIYSGLLLLPFLIWHVWSATRRDPRAIALFLLAAGIFAVPQLARAFKVTKNPLYHSRWIELAMRTDSYPGTTLYHSGSLPKAITNYLPNGGVSEVASKSSRTLIEVLSRAISTLGLGLILFIASSLIRFADHRLNQLRRLLFMVMPLHLAALSLFFSAEECVSVLLFYAPLVMTLGAGFLETVVHARRLPRLHARGVLLFWIVACCVSGVSQLLALRTAPAPARLYAFLGPSGTNLERVQNNTDGVLAADDPFTMAHYANVPVTFLPASATDFQELEGRLNKQIVAFGVTPALRWDRPEDAAIVPWAETYRRVIGLFSISELLPPAERDMLSNRIFYPESIRSSIRTFQVTPVREPSSRGDYSAIFWDLTYLRS